MTGRIAAFTAFMAAAALLLSVIALVSANGQAPDQYPLTCGQTFRDDHTGAQTPVYYPCASTRPAP